MVQFQACPFDRDAVFSGNGCVRSMTGVKEVDAKAADWPRSGLGLFLLSAVRLMPDASGKAMGSCDGTVRRLEEAEGERRLGAADNGPVVSGFLPMTTKLSHD